MRGGVGEEERLATKRAERVKVWVEEEAYCKEKAVVVECMSKEAANYAKVDWIWLERAGVCHIKEEVLEIHRLKEERAVISRDLHKEGGGGSAHILC